jgi:transglycosylase-like protein with SLT domain
MMKRGVIVTALGLMLGGTATPALAQLSPSAAPSPLARSAIPPQYLSLYLSAAQTCHGLPWQVLAAIGEMESDHGRSTAPSVHGPSAYGGAEGPMQFEPATFAAYAVQADRRHALSPYDPADAIYTAARMLCAAGASGTSGGSEGLAQAIFAYNHARWYVDQVLALAKQYSGLSVPAVRPESGAVPSVSPSPPGEDLASASSR